MSIGSICSSSLFSQLSDGEAEDGFVDESCCKDMVPCRRGAECARRERQSASSDAP